MNTTNMNTTDCALILGELIPESPSFNWEDAKRKEMTLHEYHAECERKKREHLRNLDQEFPTKTRRKRKKRKDQNKNECNKDQKEDKIQNEVKTWATVASKKPKQLSTTIRLTGLKKADPVSKSLFINTTLILKNLPHHGVEVRDLKRLFGQAGSLKFINILTNDDGLCRGIAFVRYEHREGSDKGLEMDGFWYNDRKIFVEYAHDKRDNDQRDND